MEVLILKIDFTYKRA